ncbi:unnamed protein product [Cylindrotheca closterium]|uniref:guanylate cyclase n=1 Tax=Cylindrotheca closterium TaxID=2856 RepID=A0AAD2FQU3_9STRA|nr:unnamed protein product [Cylindrotheca closterium]
MKVLILQWMMLLHLTMAQDLQQYQSSCFTGIPIDSSRHKPKYKIGVLANRGVETAYTSYNATFAEYLSATAGKRFDPPIDFEMVDVSFVSMFEQIEAGDLDFLFSSPSVSSCIATQFATQSLASLIVSTEVGVQTVSMSEFGGLIITQAGNDNINTITDLRNKTIAAISIAGFGSGLMQFYEMQKNGMSFVTDPAQLVFTGNQDDIVRGVLDGTFDVGFVRTGLIERTRDEEGNLVDFTKIKIIDSRQDMTASGTVFPYKHSTPLYPEWNFVATKKTPFEISQEVQAALLSVKRQGDTGLMVESCLEGNINPADHCNDLAVVDPQASCDTTMDTALAAAKALSDGRYAGWRTTLSYDDVNELHFDTNILKRDPVTRDWRCSSSPDLYDKVECPVGFFKLPRDEFDSSCEDAGLICPEGSECLCKPCFEAFPVEVAPQATYKPGNGCKKMSICGTLVQNDVLNFTIADNLELRERLNLRVVALEGNNEREIDVVPGQKPNQYVLPLTSTRVGLMVLEIFNGEEQIDESPLRVQVVYHTCPTKQTPNEDGTCRCEDRTFSMFGRCVEGQHVMWGTFIPIMTILAVCVSCYVRKKSREADSLWLVKSSELELSDPPKVIGEGRFGFVLLANYRGSKVAVKKVLPTKRRTGSSGSTFWGGWSNSSGSKSISNSKRDESGALDTYLDLEEGSDRKVKRSSTSLTSGSAESKLVDFTDRPDTGKKTSVTFSMEVQEVSIDSDEENILTASSMESKSRFRRKSEFVKEMRLLSKLRHPNITTVMGAVIEKGVEQMMIMEYMEHGSLQEVLLNPSIMLEADLIHSILQDIAQGVRFLHASKPPIVHGDLKTGNILIDSKFRAKLSDFGLSHRNTKSATGTPLWMAPELLTGRSLNTRKSDMYSVGIMMNEVFSRQEPYSEATESNEDLINAITDSRQSRRPLIPTKCPVKAKKLVQFLWHSDPELRPSAEELDNRLQELDASVFEAVASRSNRRLLGSQNQAESKHFLYQAFPRHVAEVIAKGGKVEPESHDSVTIFFSDIVGFTKIASQFEPLKVSQLLDRLYHKFDDLSRKHELFKIETIGDAYMCAGNLATDQSGDHAKRIALFAKEAITAASETPIDEEDPSLGFIKIRVGFHSGPVVSNVVGNLNPRYGVFGDTVNVASRMESSSEVERIHCSKASARLLVRQAPEIPTTLRGYTALKGKGKMSTYWVF